MVRISNLELIRILLTNSRIKYSELARRLGVSETAVRKRIRQLEEDKVIRRYTIDVDPKRLGFDIDAIIGIDTEPEYYVHILDRLSEMDQVISVYSSSGDHMILIRAWFEDHSRLRDFVKRLEGMEGITKVCPATIIDRIK